MGSWFDLPRNRLQLIRFMKFPTHTYLSEKPTRSGITNNFQITNGIDAKLNFGDDPILMPIQIKFYTIRFSSNGIRKN